MIEEKTKNLSAILTSDAVRKMTSIIQPEQKQEKSTAEKKVAQQSVLNLIAPVKGGKTLFKLTAPTAVERLTTNILQNQKNSEANSGSKVTLGKRQASNVNLKGEVGNTSKETNPSKRQKVEAKKVTINVKKSDLATDEANVPNEQVNQGKDSVKKSTKNLK